MVAMVRHDALIVIIVITIIMVMVIMIMDIMEAVTIVVRNMAQDDNRERIYS